jgi:hypothetical protein
MTEKDKAMDLDAPLEKLLQAADNHGEDDEPGHTVGDLQGLLRAAWRLMTIDQKLRLLQSDEAEELVMLGARGEFDENTLIDNVNLKLGTMEAEIFAAGYILVAVRDGLYCWELDDNASEDFERQDAIVDAYNHLKKIGVYTRLK